MPAMERSERDSPLVLGTGKVSKLLLQYALPAIVAMTATSMYNMIDGIFIGHKMGAMAIAGLTLTFPLMNLAAAFGALVGVGASTLTAIKLGQRDKESAKQVLGNVVLMNVMIGVLFTVGMLLVLDPVLLFFGAGEGTLPYARTFMEIILAGNVITHIYMGLNEVLRASGYPRKAMMATLMAVGMNCLFAALFIFVLDWGIRGAACATILAQALALLWQLRHFFDKRNFLHFERGIFGLKRTIVKGMLAIGMSPFLMNICACFVVALITRSLKDHGGDLAISAYGIVNRVAFFFLMIVMGFNQGMQPIAGYNFGARLFPRVMQVLKYTICCAVSVTTIGFLACQLFPRTIVYLFTTDESFLHVAEEGLHVVFFFFPVVGFQMVTSSFFQSIGMASRAIFLSLTRQLLFLVPCLLILPRIYMLKGVWMSLPVADLVATVVAAIMLINQLKQFRKES
jgi:putative MATE family efflux protein